MDIKLLDVDSHDAMEYWDFLKNVLSDLEPPEVVLGKCLCGVYSLMAGYVDNRPIGAIVYVINDGICFVVSLYVPGYLHVFRDKFYTRCAIMGVKKIRALSIIEKEKFEKLTKMKAKSVLYEYEV